MAMNEQVNSAPSPLAQGVQAAAAPAPKPLAMQAHQEARDYASHWTGDMNGAKPAAGPTQGGDPDAYANAWSAEPQPMPVALQGPAAERAAGYEAAWNEAPAAAAGNQTAVDLLNGSQQPAAADGAQLKPAAPAAASAPAQDPIAAMPRDSVDNEDAYQAAVRNRDYQTNYGGA